MTLLQLGIGTVNDVADAPFDAGRKPGKPIPAGLVEAGAARRFAVASFVAGVTVAATVSTGVAALAILVVGIGLAYDLRLKGTEWSWLPFAVGIPILPVYGWLGARGGLEPPFWVLVPAAVAAGAALAISNSLVDIERDRASGRTSVAARLGRVRAGRLAAALYLAVAALDVVSIGGSAPGAAGLASLVAVSIPALAALLTVGRPALAEGAWRIEAISMASAAVAWFAAVFR